MKLSSETLENMQKFWKKRIEAIQIFFPFQATLDFQKWISISRNLLFLKSANNPQQTGSTLATLILQATWEIK